MPARNQSGLPGIHCNDDGRNDAEVEESDLRENVVGCHPNENGEQQPKNKRWSKKRHSCTLWISWATIKAFIQANIFVDGDES
jgi:hypothetical protein